MCSLLGQGQTKIYLDIIIVCCFPTEHTANKHHRTKQVASSSHQYELELVIIHVAKKNYILTLINKLSSALSTN
jgi:polysaccharide pyruvyl transferase WcaK-like protein